MIVRRDSDVQRFLGFMRANLGSPQLLEKSVRCYLRDMPTRNRLLRSNWLAKRTMSNDKLPLNSALSEIVLVMVLRR
jgi:hypothetical protein